MSIARYLPNGTLDAGFGSEGLVHFDTDAGSDEVRALRVLSDNSILAAGSLSTSSHADFGILKLRDDGSRDTTFGVLRRRVWRRMEGSSPSARVAIAA